MSLSNVDAAVAYYTAVGKKNSSDWEKYLHPDVHFIGPIAEVKGKDAVVEAVKKFTDFFVALTIRAQFGSEDQAMVVYDVDFPTPVGKTRTAALLTFQEGLIGKIEIFFDARPFAKM